MAAKSDLDGPEKIEIFKIRVKGVRRHVSTCTRPNIMTVAAQRQKLDNKHEFFALEVLLFGKLFILCLYMEFKLGSINSGLRYE